MKKIIIILVSGVVYTSLYSDCAIAQKVTDLSFVSPTIGLKSSSLNQTKNLSISDLKATLKEARVNSKVINHLNKNFKNATNILWDSDDISTTVRFQMNDKSAMVFYDKRGYWINTILTYQENQMPSHLKSLIKRNYIGFAISLIKEISQDQSTYYMVYLDSEPYFKHVLISDNEIIKEETFKYGF